jgi:hypothetical protein
MQHMPDMPGGSTARLHHRAEGSGATNVAAEHSRCDPNFPGGRDTHSALILATSGYNERGGSKMPKKRSRSGPHPIKWGSVGSEQARLIGGSVDQQLKQLMKELGEAINESLADSDQIAEVVSKIKDGGYDIFLVLEATIGISKPGDKTSDKTSMVTTLSSNPEFKVSDQDLKFLKSLRIKIDDAA